MPAAMMLHTTDPADDIRKKIGNLDHFEVMHNQILVGIYVRPEQTAAGLYLPEKTRKEDLWQGKSGLVLKKGPQAFKDDENYKFAGQNVEPGEWIAFRVSDGFPITVNNVPCRLLEEAHVKAKIPAPDYIY